MSKRDYRDSLLDIWREIKHIEQFSASVDYEELIEDEKTLYAIVRCFEVIGEAAKNIPEEIKEKYCQIPWKDMAGMRDKLIHEYFGVDHEILWETIKQQIPRLKMAYLKLLEDYKLKEFSI
ncbi:MAG: hypothetical protein B6D56_03600 [Candidatus Omnitrophica bacterium 4484_70.1]|nr:MAG: hypothetical protein B6D56_03600 [Candidatus Omnitrophica bacterium 4484_70.1]